MSDKPLIRREDLERKDLPFILGGCICGTCGDLRQCPCGRWTLVSPRLGARPCVACGRPGWCAG